MKQKGNAQGIPLRKFKHKRESWILAIISTADGYLSLKLYAKTPKVGVYRKANYWFGYTIHELRFAAGSDLELLKRWRPNLYTDILIFMEKRYSPAHLAQLGLTPRK